MYIPDGVDAVGLCEREKESGCAVVFRETDEMSIVWCHWDEWSCRNKHRTESAVSHTSQSTECMRQFYMLLYTSLLLCECKNSQH